MRLRYVAVVAGLSLGSMSETGLGSVPAWAAELDPSTVVHFTSAGTLQISGKKLLPFTFDFFHHPNSLDAQVDLRFDTGRTVGPSGSSHEDYVDVGAVKALLPGNSIATSEIDVTNAQVASLGKTGKVSNYEFKYDASIVLDQSANNVVGTLNCYCEYRVSKDDVWKYTLDVSIDVIFSSQNVFYDQDNQVNLISADITAFEPIQSGLKVEDITYTSAHKYDDRVAYEYPNYQFDLNTTSYSRIYDESVDMAVSAVPLPASAPMFGAALVALGAAGYGLKRKVKAAAEA